MTTEATVRRAEADDFDVWFALLDEVAREGRWIGADGPQSPDTYRRGFLRGLESEHAARFLAELDGVLVGELGVTAIAGVADLGMMVRDGHRRAGVGSALMSACLDWCRTATAHKVTLEVFPNNEAGMALYQKFGFVVEGRRVRHYRRATGELWDAIAMGLVLDETSPGSSYEDASA